VGYHGGYLSCRTAFPASIYVAANQNRANLHLNYSTTLQSETQNDLRESDDLEQSAREQIAVRLQNSLQPWRWHWSDFVLPRISRAASVIHRDLVDDRQEQIESPLLN
jgi:hypothetical protein